MDRKTRQFNQFLGHEVGDEEKVNEYLKESLPLVGEVVMYFNSLERTLSQFVCEILSDRTDSVGLTVLKGMQYRAKLDLFLRFEGDLHRDFGRAPESYNGLKSELEELGSLRNTVVHADFENTDEMGYTFVHVKHSKSGMSQEYVQFSVSSLIKVVNRIIEARNRLCKYWDGRNGLLHL